MYLQIKKDMEDLALQKGVLVACHMVPTKFPIIIASASFGSLNFDGFCHEDADRGEHARALVVNTFKR